jgi:hypothetical protein
MAAQNRSVSMSIVCGNFSDVLLKDRISKLRFNFFPDSVSRNPPRRNQPSKTTFRYVSTSRTRNMNGLSNLKVYPLIVPELAESQGSSDRNRFLDF